MFAGQLLFSRSRLILRKHDVLRLIWEVASSEHTKTQDSDGDNGYVVEQKYYNTTRMNALRELVSKNA